MSIEYKLDKKGINSKILFTEVSNFVQEGFDQIGSIFSRDNGRSQFVLVLSDFLQTLLTNDILTHWNVICDLRNNKVVDMENGQYRLTISYKQRNCLNTTERQYFIRVDKNADWAIDFSI